MRTLILWALLISTVWCEKRVTLGRLEAMDGTKLYDRMRYLRNANQSYLWKLDSQGHYVFSVRHPLVDTTKLFSLDVVLYGLNAAGRRVDPPNLSLQNVDGFTDLQFFLAGNEFDDAHGCQQLRTENERVGKVCNFAIDYIATDQDAVLITLSFKFRVIMPQSQSQSTGPIEIHVLPKENALRQP